MEIGITERREKILAYIVKSFITTGEPVGSKALIDYADLSISSATVRNEMAALTELGLIDQPYISSGRVPTNLGYRYYVDNLMGRYEISESDKRYIDAELQNTSTEAIALLDKAAKVLADLSDCAALTTTPKDRNSVVKRAELLPLGRHTAMVVLLTSSGILKSSVTHTDGEITPDIIEHYYNIVNVEFFGKPASEITTAKIQTLALSMGGKAFVITPLLVALQELSRATERSEIILEGQHNILNHEELINTAGELLTFLSDKEPLKKVFESGIKQSGTKTLIGSENYFTELRNSSLVFGEYNLNGAERGAMGIIGPTRIDYEKLIPRLEYLTKAVGEILSRNSED